MSQNLIIIIIKNNNNNNNNSNNNNNNEDVELTTHKKDIYLQKKVHKQDNTQIDNTVYIQ